MTGKNILPNLLISLGCIIVIIAIFARIIGLDQNDGWSKLRIATLLLGMLIILVSLAYKKYTTAVTSFLEWVIALPSKVPMAIVITTITVITIFAYAWFASPGKSNEWGQSTTYFDILAQSFANGMVHLSTKPSTELLALSNPYNPAERAGLPVPIDYSLYDGKYYLYWGPVPAYILSVIYRFIPIKIGDLFITFIFVSGIFISQTSTLYMLWNRYFYDLPKRLFYISFLIVGFCGPLLFLRHKYGSARVYEAAITGSQFFFMAGMFFWVYTLMQQPISKWRLTTAIILWSLAIGTRHIIVMPIGLLCVMFVFQNYFVNSWTFKKTTSILPYFSPLVLMVVCLGWYNWVRFESFTETGITYQLSAVNLKLYKDELFSIQYIWQNLYNYLFHGVEFKSKFPFASVIGGSETSLISFYSVPDLYTAEIVAGLVYIFPFSLFSCIPIFNLLFTKNGSKDPLNNINLTLIISFLCMFGIIILFFWCGLRYLEDFLPSLSMLSIIGFWQGYKLITPKILSDKWYINLSTLFSTLVILLNILMASSTNRSLMNLIFRNYPFLQ